MQNEQRPYAPPAGAHDARTPQPVSAAGPDQPQAPVNERAAGFSEWEDTAMDAPCL